MPKNLFKTTVVIWSEFDPMANEVELSDLARQAEEGAAYASSQTTVAVPEAALAHDRDATDGMFAFFEIETPEGDTNVQAPGSGLRVSADLISDDGQSRATFDATAWFETARPQEIIDLIQCDFGGDYAADAVARHFYDIHEDVTAVLERCDGEGLGYEVYVNGAQAVAWIATARGYDTDLLMALADTNGLD